MCNNMLQFGHFYAFARKNNIPIIGMRFCYKYLDFNLSDQKGYNFFNYLFAKYGSKMGLIPKVEFEHPDAELALKTDLLKNSRMILADGWGFRNYDLFLEYRKEITSLFDFRERVKMPVDNYLKKVAKDKKRIGLHIRRGDYIKWQGGKYYFSDQEYAIIAKTFIAKEGLQDAEIFIVTNDKNVDKGYLKNALGKDIHLLNGSPAEDLYLLSSCDYIIGPPSTFSLMAAFYQDKDLYWIFDKQKAIGRGDFKKFAECFRNII